MQNNYGGGYRTEIEKMQNGGGYYNSYNKSMADALSKGSNASCYFPGPPPKRVYCEPAPFTNPLGMGYNRLTTAYGASRAHF